VDTVSGGSAAAAEETCPFSLDQILDIKVDLEAVQILK